MRMLYSESTTDSPERKAGLSMILRDVLELAELQGLLVKAGCREASSHLRRSLLFGGIALVGALAATLLLMQATAVSLATSLGVSEALGQLIIAGLVLIAVSLVALQCLSSLKRTATIAAESSDELAANLRAIREALTPASAVSDRDRYESALRTHKNGSRTGQK